MRKKIATYTWKTPLARAGWRWIGLLVIALFLLAWPHLDDPAAWEVPASGQRANVPGTERLGTTSLGQDIPEHFRRMLEAEPTGTTYYIAQQQPGASNENDGLAPVHQAGRHGPWKDPGGLAAFLNAPGSPGLQPGDAVAIRQGIYQMSDRTLPLPFNGTVDRPIRIYAYQGEEVVIEGGFDPEEWAPILEDPDSHKDIIEEFKHKPVLRFDGEHIIVDGIEVRGCYLVCILWWTGAHDILMNSTIRGSIEDGIKTTFPSHDNLILGNEFTGFGDQAIDVWGATDYYIVQNEFHHSNEDLPWGVGNPVWTKGGSVNVHFLDNHFHDLTVKTHALNLGGCCWNNWTDRMYDDEGRLRPVAEQVFAYGNTFERVRIQPGSPAPYPGVVGVEGCRNCEVRDNLILDADDAFGIHATASGGNRMPPENVLITGNTAARIATGRLYNIVHDYGRLTIDYNSYYVDEPVSIRIGRSDANLMSFGEFQAMGFDTHSVLRPAGDYENEGSGPSKGSQVNRGVGNGGSPRGQRSQ